METKSHGPHLPENEPSQIPSELHAYFNCLHLEHGGLRELGEVSTYFKNGTQPRHIFPGETESELFSIGVEQNWGIGPNTLTLNRFLGDDEKFAPHLGVTKEVPLAKIEIFADKPTIKYTFFYRDEDIRKYKVEKDKGRELLDQRRKLVDGLLVRFNAETRKTVIEGRIDMYTDYLRRQAEGLEGQQFNTRIFEMEYDLTDPEY